MILVKLLVTNYIMLKLITSLLLEKIAKRNTFTTGLSEIVGHKGKDHAQVYEEKLKCLAVLSETTVGELKELIDF